MSRLLTAGRIIRFALVILTFTLIASAQQQDPKAIKISLPADLKWSADTGSSQNITLVGDPSKEGLYVVLTKWPPHRMSRPHFHPNDRYITVIKGTWWVGTGTKYDPDHTTPVPEGSFVTHYGKGIHYDGAKDGEVILQIVGMGPATGTSAEQKE